MNRNFNIDFVILWVDGHDSEWLRKKRNFAPSNILSSNTDDSSSDCRYRGDDELLRYWFRGVENNAPWVHKVFFVSDGQVPTWLNRDHPKLEIVNHNAFIPKVYLPTFNSNTIQFNLHRIETLSEHFVLFDDDVFLLRSLSPEFYFRRGNPVLDTYLGILNVGYSNWHRIMFNNTAIINKQFNAKESIWRYRRKWFDIKNLGISFAVYNYVCFMVNKIMPVHCYGHLSFPHLKSTFEKAWSAQREILHMTCMHKVRLDDEVNHYLLCAWNQLSGRFISAPVDSHGKFFTLSPKDIDIVSEAIRLKTYPVVCINDSSNNIEPNFAFSQIKAAFKDIYPVESEFEK